MILSFLGIVSIFFQVPNFQGCFEALNNVFWTFGGLGDVAKSCNPQIVISNEILCTPNRDRMQKFHAQEVDVTNNHLEARNTFGVSSSKVRVLMFRFFASLYFRIHDKRNFSTSL
jgi:hypothetical protein